MSGGDWEPVESIWTASLGEVVTHPAVLPEAIRLPVDGPSQDWRGFAVTTDPAMPRDVIELRGVDRNGKLFRRRVPLPEAP
jgi:hypothetical protein